MRKIYLSLLVFICLALPAQAQVSSYASIPYSTSFESGSLDANWYTTSTAGGRIQVWLDSTLTWNSLYNDSHTGNYALGMDASPGGSYATNQSWMGLDLFGATSVVLDFWWSEWNDESEPQDGVYFSDNGGATFTKVLDLNGAAYTDLQWYHFNINVDSTLAVHGLSATSNFVVMFQQYDNYYFAGGNDGHFYDDITVTGSVCLAAPSFTSCVNNIVQEVDPGMCTATVSWTDPVATAPCPNSPPVSQTAGPANGGSFSLGTTTVTYVTSTAGGSDTCSFTVTVVDTTGPVISCQNYTVQLDSNGSASFNAGNLLSSISDGCGVATVTLSDTMFSCSDLGANTVTVTATDVNGNVSTCTSTVTVADTAGVATPQVDLGPDIVLCPGGNAVLDAGAGFSSYTWTGGSNGQTLTVSAPGSYSVTVTNAGGCPGTDMITVGAPLTDPVATQMGDSVCVDYGSNIQWYYNGSPVSGGTTPCIETTGAGSYYAQVEDSLGCVHSSDTVMVVSVHQPLANQVQVQAWPNPFDRQLNLQVELAQSQNLSIEIFSFTGVKVAVLHQGQVAAGQQTFTWSAEDMPAGVYLYRISGEGMESLTGRVVLAH